MCGCLSDGFGSSASDPNLQKKYGHVKEIVTTAPPPIFRSPSGGEISQPPSMSYPGGPIGGENSSTFPPRPPGYNPYSISAANNSTIPIQQPSMTPMVVPGRNLNPYAANISVGRLPDGSKSTSEINDVDVFNPSTDISIIASSSSSAVL
jgi:hypothetical protein